MSMASAPQYPLADSKNELEVAMQTTHDMPPSVVAQVTALTDMPWEALKALWQELYQEAVPTHNRTFIEKRLAFRLQELALKGKGRELLKQNKRRIEALIEKDKVPHANQAMTPVPGTVLTRLYNDRTYTVSVTHDGQYDFEGRLYSSLSPIAREITGTRWSGPLFFGLRKRASGGHKKRGNKA